MMSQTMGSRGWMWLLALLFVQAGAQAAGVLRVEDAWVRIDGPDPQRAVGYAVLRNEGDAPIRILTVQSNQFRTAQIQRTVQERQRTRRHEVHRLAVDPGESVELHPGGLHLELGQPRQQLVLDEPVEVMFLLADGTRVATLFNIVPATSPAQP